MWDKIVPGSMEAPNFSAYPWHLVPRRSRRDAAIESAIARWLRAKGPWRAAIVRAGHAPAIDAHAACCELRIAGESIELYASGDAVRALAQRELGGPAELAAPRPLGAVEHAMWALAVARVLDELAIAGEVWPRAARGTPHDGYAIELAVELAGRRATVVAIAPRALELRAAPPGPVPGWRVEAPIAVARCAIDRAAVAALAVRDLVTVERCCDLEIFGGVFGLSGKGMVAEVASEYVRRDMAFADDAQVELTVTAGSVRLPLRRVLDLAVGEIVELARPLAGPFDVRAAGRLIGQGELVDVDGELAVRIVSLEEKSE
jgi:hypothetical protein